MSILNKAILSVTATTFITSGAILLTASSSADSTAPQVLQTPNVDSKVALIAIDKKLIAKTIDRVLEAPPGPFMDREAPMKNTQIAPLLPKEPVQAHFDVMAPMKSIAPVLNIDPSRINHEQYPTINSQDMPIWMQDNDGLAAHIFNKMPPKPPVQALTNDIPVQNWNNSKTKQISNMGWVNQQQYIYVPVPLLPQYFGAAQIPNYLPSTSVGIINLPVPNSKENIK